MENRHKTFFFLLQSIIWFIIFSLPLKLAPSTESTSVATGGASVVLSKNKKWAMGPEHATSDIIGALQYHGVIPFFLLLLFLSFLYLSTVVDFVISSPVFVLFFFSSSLAKFCLFIRRSFRHFVPRPFTSIRALTGFQWTIPDALERTELVFNIKFHFSVWRSATLRVGDVFRVCREFIFFYFLFYSSQGLSPCRAPQYLHNATRNRNLRGRQTLEWQWCVTPSRIR